MSPAVSSQCVTPFVARRPALTKHFRLHQLHGTLPRQAQPSCAPLASLGRRGERQLEPFTRTEQALDSFFKAGASILAAFVIVSHPVHASESLQGVARAVDGDTLEVAGTRIRLYGIDAPEKAQQCTTPGGKEYSCGIVAQQALVTKIGSAPVVCEVKNKDLYGRTVAACAAGNGKGGDLGEFLVENGHAVAYRQYSKAYVPLEEQAKANKRGIWAGSFQEPAMWRKEHPRNGNAAAVSTASAANLLPAARGPIAALPAPSPEATKRVPPSPSCAIKGNINAKKEKIFHVPGGRSYDATDIDLAAGERWFCSEKEAVEAGWRASKN